MLEIQTELVVHGPFPIPHDAHRKGTSKRITRDHAKEFWAQAGARGVRSKHGCYVFALAAGRGFSPWYVGKTTKTFEQEAFQDHKLIYYNDVIFKGHKGKPVMFFVAKGTGQKRFPENQIDDLETFLIQSAIYKNPALMNKQKTKMGLWGISGVVRGGKGKALANARQFKAMMRI